MAQTQVQVSLETWSRLNALKSRPSQSFDEIINLALDSLEDIE